MKSKSGYRLALLIIAIIAVAGVLIYNKLHTKKLPPYLIEGSGRIDGDLVNLNVKYPGRVIEMSIDTGESVEKNQRVALLESREFQAKLKAVDMNIEAKIKELNASTTRLDIASSVTPQRLKKAQDAVNANRSKIEEIDKGIESQSAVVEQDERDLKRYRDLFIKGLIQKELLEKVDLKYRVDTHKLEALQQKREQEKEALSIAVSDMKDAEASQKELKALSDEVSALRSGIDALKAQREEIAIMIEQMDIRSPLNGFVVQRVAEEGEVLGAGMPVATLIDPDTLYLRVFIDTLQNGKISLHDKAEIFLDAYPNRAIPAEVVAIAQKAEFTPKEVSVKSDRIERVFAVRLRPLKPNPLLKLGIPAVAVISTDSSKPLPKSLDEIPEI